MKPDRQKYSTRGATQNLAQTRKGKKTAGKENRLLASYIDAS